MKKDVINFSDFLKDNINSSKIDKEDDFSIPGTIDETTIEDPIEEVENEIDEDIINTTKRMYDEKNKVRDEKITIHEI